MGARVNAYELTTKASEYRQGSKSRRSPERSAEGILQLLPQRCSDYNESEQSSLSSASGPSPSFRSRGMAASGSALAVESGNAPPSPKSPRNGSNKAATHTTRRGGSQTTLGRS